LIEADIRIPGLKALILKFRNESLPESEAIINSNKESAIVSTVTITENSQEGHTSESESKEKITSAHGNKIDNSQATNNTSPSSSTVDNAQAQKVFARKEKQLSFFADLQINHLNPADPINQGLISVAKEIIKISSTLDFAAYARFPISSVFLVRSLIEQVVARQLMKGTAYEKLSGQSNGKSTPELGKMIVEMIKFYNNNNLVYFNNDKKLAQDFNACFTGFGTKDQLDKVIHRPAECQPDKTFLNNLAKQGLKDLLQKFINSFH